MGGRSRGVSGHRQAAGQGAGDVEQPTAPAPPTHLRRGLGGVALLLAARGGRAAALAVRQHHSLRGAEQRLRQCRPLWHRKELARGGGVGLVARCGAQRGQQARMVRATSNA